MVLIMDTEKGVISLGGKLVFSEIFRVRFAPEIECRQCTGISSADRRPGTAHLLTTGACPERQQFFVESAKVLANRFRFHVCGQNLIRSFYVVRKR